MPRAIAAKTWMYRVRCIKGSSNYWRETNEGTRSIKPMPDNTSSALKASSNGCPERRLRMRNHHRAALRKTPHARGHPPKTPQRRCHARGDQQKIDDRPELGVTQAAVPADAAPGSEQRRRHIEQSVEP